MTIFPAHRYLVIDVEKEPFNTPYVIFPAWTTTLYIIDLAKGVYLDADGWKDENGEKNWKTITEDHL